MKYTTGNSSMVKAYAVGYSHGYYERKEKDPFIYNKELSNMYHRGFGEGMLDQYVDQIDSEIDYEYEG